MRRFAGTSVELVVKSTSGRGLGSPWAHRTAHMQGVFSQDVVNTLGDIGFSMRRDGCNTSGYVVSILPPPDLKT